MNETNYCFKGNIHINFCYNFMLTLDKCDIVIIDNSYYVRTSNILNRKLISEWEYFYGNGI